MTSAFLFRTPEPIDLTRLSLAMSRANQLVPSPLAAKSAKLVAAVLGAQQPRDESITLLVREALSLRGYRIEKRDFSGFAFLGGVLPFVEMDDPTSNWKPFFQFRNEPKVADGTRVIVYSGNADNAPTVAPRILQRFRFGAGEVGDMQLAEDAVDLRLVAPNGSVVHARRFLKGSLYNSVKKFTLLRKSDGTAFFTLPYGLPGGANFPQGSYRMSMDFRRNNTAIDSNSVISSEVGQTTAESAVLDIPWSAM